MQITHLLDGHEQLIRAAVLNVQKIFAHAVKFKRLDAEILADTVFDVHDVIAGVNIAEVANLFAAVGRNFRSLVMNLPAENILLRQHGEFYVRQCESVAQIAAFKFDARKMIFVQQLHYAVEFCLAREQYQNFLLELQQARYLVQKKFRLPLEARYVRRGYADSFSRLDAANFFYHQLEVNQRT